MFGGLGWPEASVIVVLALFVFGPDKLPGMAQELGKTIRKGKAMLQGVTDDLKTELGPELGDLELSSLNPKTFVRNMWDAEDEPPAVPDLVDQLSGRPRGTYPLPEGELAPWDPDTT